MKNFFSKIFRKPAIAVAKSADEEKESQVKERPGAYATGGDYVTPEYEDIGYSDIQSLYDQSSLLKKYIKIITDELKRYEIKVRPKDKTKKKHREKAAEINKKLLNANSIETFQEVREKYTKDLFLYGRAGIEIEPTESDNLLALYAVPGYSIRLNVDETGANFKNEDKAYTLVDPENTEEVSATFPQDSFIYLVLDKLSDRVYGSQPIASIYSELRADIKASKNVEAGTNAIKAGVLCLPKAPRKLLKQVLTNLARLVSKNAKTKIVAANSDGRFLDLSNLKPEDNVDLQKWLIKKANIFNIPLFKLGITTTSGSLNAREQKDDFRAMVESMVRYEVEKLNKTLINDKLKISDQVEIYCPNFATKLEYERTRVAVRLRNAGLITANEARSRYLGMDPLDDPEANELLPPSMRSQNEPPKE
jgi:hypothetical protein